MPEPDAQMSIGPNGKFRVTALVRGFGNLSAATEQAGKSLASFGDSLGESMAMAMKAYQAGLISAQDAREALGLDYVKSNQEPNKLVLGVDYGPDLSYTTIHEHRETVEPEEPKISVKKHVDRERRLALDKNI